MNTLTTQSQSIGLLNLEAFELSQRIAKMLSASSLVPEQYRATIKVKGQVQLDGSTRYKDNKGNWLFREEANPNGLANCVIALNMASRLNADPLMVMQNLYLIEGRPAWSSQFIMAAINSCGRFSALRFDIQDLGEKEIDYTETEWTNGDKKTVKKKIKIQDLSCVAFAVERETGERIESSKITIEMAVKEGWYQKNGSKWQTMPEQMLRYRAASFFGRVYAPELLMGLRSAEEEHERTIIDVTPTTAEETPVSEIDVRKLKRKILTAKSIDELDELREQIGEHEELLKLLNAQEDKFTQPVAEAKPETESKVDTTPQVEEKPSLYTEIDNAQSVDELKTIGKQIIQAERDGQINSNESQQVKDYYAQRKAVLETTPQQLPDESVQAIIEALDKADDMDAVNAIMQHQFEPFTSSMNQAQIDSINTVYERREAELTA